MKITWKEDTKDKIDPNDLFGNLPEVAHYDYSGPITMKRIEIEIKFDDKEEELLFKNELERANS